MRNNRQTRNPGMYSWKGMGTSVVSSGTCMARSLDLLEMVEPSVSSTKQASEPVLLLIDTLARYQERT